MVRQAEFDRLYKKIILDDNTSFLSPGVSFVEPPSWSQQHITYHQEIEDRKDYLINVFRYIIFKQHGK